MAIPTIKYYRSIAWPDRFFPFLFVVAEKRVWSGSHTHLVLAPRKVTIEHVIVAQVYDRVRLLFGQFVDAAYISTACISDFPLSVVGNSYIRNIVVHVIG